MNILDQVDNGTTRLFNCASFETNFGSIGPLKKTLLFNFSFCISEYNRECTRELTCAVTVDSLSLAIT